MTVDININTLKTFFGKNGEVGKIKSICINLQRSTSYITVNFHYCRTFVDRKWREAKRIPPSTNSPRKTHPD